MFNDSTGRYTCYGPMVKKRLDPFHQPDIRVEKMWTFNDFRLSAYLDLINAYFHNSPDIVVPKYDLSGYKPLSMGLPILPSIGVRGALKPRSRSLGFCNGNAGRMRLKKRWPPLPD